MGIVEPQPTHKPGDELEELLRAFFRSQMPSSWPPPRVSNTPLMFSRRPTTARHSLIRSRWALAASVAVLLLGSLLLPGRFPQEAKPAKSLGNVPMIGSNPFYRQMEREHKRRPPHNQNKPGVAVEDDDQLPEMNDGNLPPLP